MFGQKIRNTPAPLGVAQGGHHPARFVEEHNTLVRDLNAPPVYLDLVSIRIYLASELGHDLTINTYPSLCDELLHRATRSYPALCKKLLQPNIGHTLPQNR
jgi:hypothetical protein